MSRLFLYRPARGYGVGVGRLAQNAPHRHYAMHVVIPLGSPVDVVVDGERARFDGAGAIASNALHTFPESAEQPMALASVSPLSNLGRSLSAALGGAAWGRLPAGVFGATADDGTTIGVEKLRASSEARLGLLAVLEAEARTLCERERERRLPEATADGPRVDPFAPDFTSVDPRVVRVVVMMAESEERVLGADEAAAAVALSRSRFLHLFRAELGLTFRRMQVWVRLARAVAGASACESLTELAHASGFADSAHFSRAFRESFGMPPSVILQKSTFIQVD